MKRKPHRLPSAIFVCLFAAAFPGPAVAQTIATTIPIPTTKFLSRVALDPSRDRAYLVDQTAFTPSTLFVIDTNTNEIVQSIPFSVFAPNVVFNPANDKLYLTAQVNGHVKVLDADTLSETQIAVPGFPTGIAVNPVTNKIYVTSQGFALNDKLFVIDGATNAVSGPFDLQGVAGEVRVNPTTNRIYATAGSTCSNLKTRVFSGADNSVITDLPLTSLLAGGGGGDPIDPVKNRIYVASTDPSNCARTALRVLDGNDHSLVATISGIPLDVAVAINPDLERAYFSLFSLNQIATFSTATHTEIQRLTVAAGPSFASVGRTTARIYVSHNGPDRLVTVLEGVPDEFFDPFDSTKLDPAWVVVPGMPATCTFSLTENPGHLRYRPDPFAQPRGCGLQLIRAFRGDQWTFETEVTYFTGPSGGGRQLVLSINFGQLPSPHSFGNPTDNLVFFRGRDDWTGCCPGNLNLSFVDNGQFVPPGFFGLPLNPNFSNVGGFVTDSYLLQVRRSGRTVTFEVSDDGVNVRFSASHTFGSQIDGQVQYLLIHGNSFANFDSFGDYDFVRLSKTPTNQPPVAAAGADQTVECTGFDGASVTLDGSGSSDPDNDPLGFEWKDASGSVVGTTPSVNLTLPLGSHTFTLTVDDGQGGTASDTVTVTVQDTTPPTLTLAQNTVTTVIPTASATTAPVDLTGIASASDVCDPAPVITNNAPAQFPIGVTTVTFTATDASGNFTQKQLNVHVVYNFIGFLPPIRNDGSSIFKSGRTVPLKFQLTAADGTFVSTATATLQVFKITDSVLGSVEVDSSGEANADTSFRFDPSTNQYIFNLSTKGYSSGTYLLRVSLNDQTTHEVQVSVR